MGLGDNPYATSNIQDDAKWADIGGMKGVHGAIIITPKQQRDAQITTVELMGYEFGKGESMKFLEMLGIDRKVKKDDDCKDC